jgi:NCAIR mutase (PurE)-related protein
MDREKLRRLLEDVKEGRLDVADAEARLKTFPFESLGFASVDAHREFRRGFPEVVLCEGKSTDEVVGIARTIFEKSGRLLATRAAAEVFEALKEAIPGAVYNERGRVISAGPPVEVETRGPVLVLSAGTADLHVAEEARVTAEMMGNEVRTRHDVGVAGIHRLASAADDMKEASVIVCCAGMEGALPSVVAGLVDVPVVAVPTSTGYGVSLGGLSALFSMLNSCSAGVTVVNIDNGFGAAYAASLINRK